MGKVIVIKMLRSVRRKKVNLGSRAGKAKMILLLFSIAKRLTVERYELDDFQLVDFLKCWESEMEHDEPALQLTSRLLRRRVVI